MFLPKVASGILALILFPFASASGLKIDRTFFFSDEKIPITLEEGEKLPLTVQLLTEQGWDEESSIQASHETGLFLQPTKEGIYIVKSDKGEVRLLVATPPSSLRPPQKERLKKLLPSNGKALLEGKPFHILAMGDSVTATGEFPEFLKQLLARSTGNTNIHAEKRAHSGKSVDASVRQWDKEIPTLKAPPQLTLIEYGLNDQAAHTPRRAYIEQTEWLRQRLTSELKSDVIFMEATPHIEKHDFSIARTLPFTGSLRALGEATKTSVIPTFAALWRDGGIDFEEVARRQWPLFPLRYNLPFSSLLENGGKGDTIHPNALGHLLMAQAIFRHLTEEPAPPTLVMKGGTQWEKRGLVTRLTIRSDRALSGILSGVLAGMETEKLPYQITPNTEAVLEIVWKEIQSPADLLEERFAREFRGDGPYLTLINQMGARNEVYSVAIPLPDDSRFVEERLISEDGKFTVTLRSGKTIEAQLPAGHDVGRLPFIFPTGDSSPSIPGAGGAATFLSFTRFGAADSREIGVDAELSDWTGAPSPISLGEKAQARGAKGPLDHRTSLEEAYLHWNFAAGEKALFVALRGKGNLENDSFTLFFDPRAPEKLGTVGPYYWIDGKFEKEGIIRLKAGSSSPETDEKPLGRWKKTETGIEAELAIPYALLAAAKWPESGDLGVSIMWSHRPEGKEPTQLLWGETGHPWNARNYGVVRLNPKGPLPYRILIE